MAYAGDVATPVEKLPKEKHIDEFKMEACIVTADITWGAERDWKWKGGQDCGGQSVWGQGGAEG